MWCVNRETSSALACCDWTLDILVPRCYRHPSTLMHAWLVCNMHVHALAPSSASIQLQHGVRCVYGCRYGVTLVHVDIRALLQQAFLATAPTLHCHRYVPVCSACTQHSMLENLVCNSRFPWLVIPLQHSTLDRPVCDSCFPCLVVPLQHSTLTGL